MVHRKWRRTITDWFRSPFPITLTCHGFSDSIKTAVGDIGTNKIWTIEPCSGGEWETSRLWADSCIMIHKIWRGNNLSSDEWQSCEAHVSSKYINHWAMKQKYFWCCLVNDLQFSPGSPHCMVFHWLPSAHLGSDSTSRHTTVPCCSSCFNQQRELQFHWLVWSDGILMSRFIGWGKLVRSCGLIFLSLLYWRLILLREYIESKAPTSMSVIMFTCKKRLWR